MRRQPLFFAVFLGIVFSVSALLHGYGWLRLVHDAAWPEPVSLVLSTLFSLAAIGLPFSLFLARTRPVPAVSWAAFVWLGTIFYLDVSYLALDGLRALSSVALASTGAAMTAGSGRTFALVGATLGLVLVGGGLLRGRSPIVRRVSVPIANLPAAFEGFRIVQLTDVHVSSITKRPFVEQLVREVAALSPDVVAITGDLVDGSVDALRDDVAPLADLRSQYGVFFVTGNHEYFSGADAWSEHVASLGIEVLRNRHVRLEKDGEAITLAGIDDAHAPRFGGTTDLDHALAGRDPALPVVLLAHQPRSVTEAAKAGVALQISGHTHGGQMQPFGALVRVEQPFLRGLHSVGETKVWVSEGTGTWGPPLRVGTRSEISVISLHRA